MKPEAQRIAIAEACGYKPVNGPRLDIHYFQRPWDRKVVPYAHLPNCVGCLNAMHDAEKVLSGRLRDRYELLLCQKLGTPCFIYATAAQRAEAFLRAIGKWEEAS